MRAGGRWRTRSRTRHSACACHCRNSPRCPPPASRTTAAACSRSSIATTVRATARRFCRWIRRLLAAENLAADGEIVLYAFPRMLGYVFNPVSFWVCHDANGGVAPCARGQQHVWRESQLPARAPARPRSGVGRDADGGQGVPRVTVLPGRRPLHLPLSLRRRPLARADRLISMLPALWSRCSRRVSPAAWPRSTGAVRGRSCGVIDCSPSTSSSEFTRRR